ncbi:hypothetical protein [Ktedonobacter racemifer]|uniref:hypothetical protein n=1 Tax=Ktedonobacter racemifer TaxID=363277 RepID=UPI0009FE12C0
MVARWVESSKQEHGLDVEQLAVAGDSAWDNMATVSAGSQTSCCRCCSTRSPTRPSTRHLTTSLPRAINGCFLDIK